MQFESIRLVNFRNYSRLDLEIPPGVVVFLGPNGQGKTNLMEAFHLLLRGESFRPCTTQSLIRQAEDGAAAAAVIDGRIFQKGLVHELKMSLSAGRRQIAWNNSPASAGRLAQAFPLVLFSPESLSAIKEGPDLRRQLIDDLVLTHSATAAKLLKEFRHALRVRNRILKDARLEKTSRAEARRLLESLDPNYLPLAAELAFTRTGALAALREDLNRATRAVLQLSDVDISVEYVVSGENAETWQRSDLLYAMHNRSLQLREKELATGVSLVGPQKHDIRILFSGKDSRFFCSQGQQRALILSFKMAQILYHYRAHQVYPFLLLDDVLSELDPVRRTNLVAFLRDIPAQIFLTTTDLSFSLDFGDRRLNVFRVEKGNVEGSVLTQ